MLFAWNCNMSIFFGLWKWGSFFEPFFVSLWYRLHFRRTFCQVRNMYRSSPFRSSLNTSYITSLDMCEICTETVKSEAPWTRVTSQVWTCVKYVPNQSIPKHLEHELHHRFWTCVKYVPKQSISVAPWTLVTSQVWTCVKYVPKQSIPKHLEHELHHRFGHVWSMYPNQSIPKHFEHELHHRFGHVWSMYRSSPFRSTWNTSYITGLDVCEVCT